ncbi:VacJ family lipoprotein [Sphingomonas sp. AAP5]|uniref:MlaA family lipoprotein n=1 Tax=Sphingomonas sp. AAP5 TaxID=1523415 RepID=UPI001056F378|nr:VacJ family lipoprotein [Sphingomonas sp. AAP5]QBM76611.1 VacJ family lipoprotein [Sphingomonas sp. AAP5]
MSIGVAILLATLSPSFEAAYPATPSLPFPAAGQTGDSGVAVVPREEQSIPSSKTSQSPPFEELGQTDIIVTGRARSPGDPIEAINVKSFAINQAVDGAVIGPVAHTYMRIVPQPVQLGVSNALSNIHEPVVFVNYILQMKIGKAAETLGRFAINSTIGIAGIIDIAARKPFHLPRRPNGFADTLGYYGVKPGAFIFVPLIGATTVRDLIGTLLDRAMLPTAFGKPFNQPGYVIPISVGRTLDQRAGLDDKLEGFRDSPDPYTARRDYYLQTREAEIISLRHIKPLK